MLLKKIMNIVESKRHPGFIHNSSYGLFCNTLDSLPDVKFFNYCICKNNFLSDEERKIVISIYVDSKKILNIMNRFSKKIKFKIYKKYENDKDLRFISFEKYDKSEIIDIIQNKTIYSFRILDLINLWKISLYSNENMFPKPIELKNPFTNMIFKKYNLYNIFISFSKTNFIIPDCILAYYKSNFSLYEFKKVFFPKLQYNAIEAYTKNGTVSDHHEYIISMLHEFRKTTNYAFVETRCSIFKKMKIVDLLRNLLSCYLKQKFLCNPLLKEKYKEKLKENIKLFFEKNSSLPYFFYLNETEILRYEGSDLMNRAESSLNELLSISEEDIESNTEAAENTSTSLSSIDLETTDTTSTDLSTSRDSSVSLLSTSSSSERSLTFNTENIVTNTYRPTSVYRRRRSSLILPPIVQTTYLNNNPFRPSHQLARSPINTRVNTIISSNNTQNNRSNRRINSGINFTSNIRNRLSFGF